jgi:hypothetical protein
MSFLFSFVLNELPFVAFYYLLASTLLAIDQSSVDSPGGWAAVGLAALATAGLVVVAWWGLRAGPAVDHALSEGLGGGWHTAVDAGMAARPRRRLPFARILFGPFFYRRRDVERVANISYGDAGRKDLLDVYRHRSHPSGVPILVHLHGGALFMGKKNREALPLLYRLASQGWVCISANYRLRPAARFPDHLIDFKKVLAWVREHGHEYGADPAVLFAAGSSSGGRWQRWLPSRPTNPPTSPVSRMRAPRSPAPFACTATTAAPTPRSGHPPHPWPTTELMLRPSSWRMAIRTVAARGGGPPVRGEAADHLRRTPQRRQEGTQTRSLTVHRKLTDPY